MHVKPSGQRWCWCLSAGDNLGDQTPPVWEGNTSWLDESRLLSWGGGLWQVPVAGRRDLHLGRGRSLWWRVLRWAKHQQGSVVCCSVLFSFIFSRLLTGVWVYQTGTSDSVLLPFLENNVYGAGSCMWVSHPLKWAEWCEWCVFWRWRGVVSGSARLLRGSLPPLLRCLFWVRGIFTVWFGFYFVWGFQSWALGNLPTPRSYKFSVSVDVVILFLCELCLAEVFITLL